MKKILVLGGTGFVGRHVCEKLVAAGLRVTVPTRRAANAKGLLPLPLVDVLQADVHNPQALAQLVAGHSAVVNLVAILHGRAADFERTHVSLVRSLVQAEFPTGISVLRNYDPSVPDLVGDIEQLIQAVLNIAHNAAQALVERIQAGDAKLTLRTRVARRITLNRHLHRLALVLLIEDNGPGIPETLRDRIFYPLVSGREGGSGLGLTLAQTFVQQHHGTIECESEPGKTVFKITIPLP